MKWIFLEIIISNFPSIFIITIKSKGIMLQRSYYIYETFKKRFRKVSIRRSGTLVNILIIMIINNASTYQQHCTEV